VAAESRALLPLVRTLTAQQERLSHDVRATFDSAVSWLAAQRQTDRATLEKLAEDQGAIDERLSRLVARSEPGTDAHGARAELEALSRALDAAIDSDEPTSPPQPPLRTAAGRAAS
jgi:hypothetical protein